MKNFEIRVADHTNEHVRTLLREHLDGMRENSPPGAVHALDLEGLQHQSISLLAVWDHENLLAVGALKEIAVDHGEIKSMRTASEHLRKGAAAYLLEHLVALARQRGYRRISLETGSGAMFMPAIVLYSRFGFVLGDSSSSYTATKFNQFMHLDL